MNKNKNNLSVDIDENDEQVEISKTSDFFKGNKILSRVAKYHSKKNLNLEKTGNDLDNYLEDIFNKHNYLKPINSKVNAILQKVNSLNNNWAIIKSNIVPSKSKK